MSLIILDVIEYTSQTIQLVRQDRNRLVWLSSVYLEIAVLHNIITLYACLISMFLALQILYVIPPMLQMRLQVVRTYMLLMELIAILLLEIAMGHSAMAQVSVFLQQMLQHAINT